MRYLNFVLLGYKLLNVLICSNFHLLQSMYEDSKTRLRWFRLSRYDFPSDLPENVGRPCTTDSNEVEYFLYFFFELLQFPNMFCRY